MFARSCKHLIIQSSFTDYKNSD